MKKVYIVLLAAVLTASYAQAQFTFGLRTGFNLTTMTEEGIDTKMKPGFQIGVVGDYALSDNFSIQPGVLFATQGFRWNLSLMGADLKTSINLNYLQIPVNAQYKLDLGGMNLLLQAGPYLGYAVSGKVIAKAGGLKEEEKINFGSNKEEMKAFDFGLGLGAGLQFGNIQAGLGYNIGLANLSNVEDSSTKNNGLALTVTYLFGK